MKIFNRNNLSELLSLENPDEDLCISAYFPTSSHNVLDMQTTIKSKLLELLRSDERTKENNMIHQDIVDEVLKSLNNVEGIKGGVAVFAKINIQNYHENKNSENYVVYHLVEKPLQECTIGRLFDIDQLLFLTSATENVLVVNVAREEIKIYEFIDDNLVIKTIVNNDAVYNDNEPNRTGAPGTTTFGDKGNKEQRSDDKFDGYFLNKFYAEISKDSFNLKKHDVVLVFHSRIFNEEEDKLKKRIHDLGGKKVEILYKNLTTENDLKQEVNEYLSNYIKNQRDEVIKKANDEHRISRGIEDVIGCAREGRIECLLIKPTLKVPGFVFQKQFPFLAEQPGGENMEVKNICTWIARNVINTNGAVMLLENDYEHDMLALLRY